MGAVNGTRPPFVTSLRPFVTLLGAKRVTASAGGNSRHTFFFARPYLLRSRWETIPVVWTLSVRGNAMRVMGVGLAHINQCQLAKRWNMSPRTLERWRWLGRGPVFLKLGGRVVYRLEDIENYEVNHLQANTNGPLPTGSAQTGCDG